MQKTTLGWVMSASAQWPIRASGRDRRNILIKRFWPMVKIPKIATFLSDVRSDVSVKFVVKISFES